MKLGFSLAQTVSQSCVEWSVPGLREGLVERIAARAAQEPPPRIAAVSAQGGGNRQRTPARRRIVAGRIWRRSSAGATAWKFRRAPGRPTPFPRICVRASRCWATIRKPSAPAATSARLRQKLEQVKAKPAPDDSAWTRAAQQWERARHHRLGFRRLAARASPSAKRPGAGLCLARAGAGQGAVNLRLFRTEDSARQASLGGIQKLVELALSKDFAWLHRDLRVLNRFEALAANLCSLEELQETALRKFEASCFARRSVLAADRRRSSPRRCNKRDC